MKCRIENVRGAFLNLHEPREPMNGDGAAKYDGTFILSPKSRVVVINPDKTTSVSTIEAVLDAVASEKWKANGPKIWRALEESKCCYRDGDNKLDKSGEPYAGFEGAHYIVAKNERQPRLKNRAKVDLTTTRDILNLMYSGAYFDIVGDFYAMDKPGQGKGLFATLKGVQFRGDGDAFGGGAPAGDDDFSDETADEASDLT